MPVHTARRRSTSSYYAHLQPSPSPAALALREPLLLSTSLSCSPGRLHFELVEDLENSCQRFLKELLMVSGDSGLL